MISSACETIREKGELVKKAGDKSDLSFSAAGCLFIGNTHVLAGYQPHKRVAVITGFGGKRNEAEEPLHTAWRETLEELLGWNKVPEEDLQRGINQVPLKSMESNGYIQIVYSFDTLETVLKGIQKTSPLYNTIPRSIGELVLNRINCKTEVPVLSLLPLDGQLVAKHFIKDIQNYIHNRDCLI